MTKIPASVADFGKVVMGAGFAPVPAADKKPSK